MVAISADDRAALESWRGRFGAAIEFLADPTLAAIGAYALVHPGAAPSGAAAARPATFVVGRDGRVRYARAASSVLDRPDPAEVFDALEAASR